MYILDKTTTTRERERAKEDKCVLYFKNYLVIGLVCAYADSRHNYKPFGIVLKVNVPYIISFVI